MKDLVALVADVQMEAALKKILLRERDLGIAKLTFDIYVHGQRDPGVFGKCHEFLRPFQRQYRFALVLFDRDGCGAHKPAAEIQKIVTQRLDKSGWQHRSHVIVIDPELEIWAWAGSPFVAQALGLSDDQLNQVLTRYNRDANNKPHDPKKAMEDALRKARRPRSAAIYAELAARAPFQSCEDHAFVELQSTLFDWFGKKE